jgi:hypothetical protein
MGLRLFEHWIVFQKLTACSNSLCVGVKIETVNTLTDFSFKSADIFSFATNTKIKRNCVHGECRQSEVEVSYEFVAGAPGFIEYLLAPRFPRVMENQIPKEQVLFGIKYMVFAYTAYCESRIYFYTVFGTENADINYDGLESNWKKIYNMTDDSKVNVVGLLRKQH